MRNVLNRVFLWTALALVGVLGAGQDAKATPYNCVTCRVQPWSIDNALYWYQEYFNNWDAIDITWHPSYPKSLNNQDAWDNATWGTNNFSKPIWNDLIFPPANDYGGIARVGAISAGTYEDLKDVTIPGIQSDVMDHAGMIAAVEADIATAQSDITSLADDMAAAQAVLLTLPSPSEFAGMEADLAGKVDKTTTVNGHSLTGNVTVTPSDLGLGSAALLNVPSSGDAASGQVVKGNDGRLTDSRTPTAHNHAASEITSGTLDDARIPTLAQSKVTNLTTDLAAKSAKASFSGVSTLAAHGVSNGATDGATDAPTNAPTDAPTNYGLLAAILGSDINATNAKQNTTAGNVNSLAAKYNALATKYNDLATKVNTLMTWLNTAKDRVNDMKAAGAN